MAQSSLPIFNPRAKAMTRTLRACVENTNFSLPNHVAFWDAASQYIPPGALADNGALGKIWVSTTPKQPAAPAGLDPRGSEEAGMVGPAMKAPVKPGDSYLLVNDRDEDVEAYDHAGKLLWKAPGLARGQGSDWRRRNGDAPPGLYVIGQIYKDYERFGASPAYDQTLMSYGWYSFDMVELENQETKHGRAGIMLHGGGSACGWPGAWAPKQRLFPTHGCIRMHNSDLRDKVLPLTKKGKVYIGVFQEK